MILLIPLYDSLMMLTGFIMQIIFLLLSVCSKWILRENWNIIAHIPTLFFAYQCETLFLHLGMSFNMQQIKRERQRNSIDDEDAKKFKIKSNRLVLIKQISSKINSFDLVHQENLLLISKIFQMKRFFKFSNFSILIICTKHFLI